MRRFGWPAFMLLLFGIALGVFFLFNSVLNDRDERRDHRSTNANRWGTMALLEVYSNLGWSTQRARVSPARLDLQPTDAFLLLDPRHEPSLEEFNHLWNLVDQGALLVFAPRSPEPAEGDLTSPTYEERRRATTHLQTDEIVLTYLGLRRQDTTLEGLQRVEPPAAGGLLSTVDQLFLPSRQRLEPFASREDAQLALEAILPYQQLPSSLPDFSAPRVLLRDNAGPLLLEVPLGRGRVLVLCDVELLSNGFLDQADNSLLAAALVENVTGTIYFDEYSHVRSVPLAPGELPTPTYSLALWLALAAVVVFTLGQFWRFSPPRAAVEPPRRSVLEYVDAIAALQRHARTGGRAVKTVGEDFRRRLASRWHLSPWVSDDQLLEAAERHGMSTERLSVLLADLRQNEETDRFSEQEVLRFVQRVADLEEERN